MKASSRAFVVAVCIQLGNAAPPTAGADPDGTWADTVKAVQNNVEEAQKTHTIIADATGGVRGKLEQMSRDNAQYIKGMDGVSKAYVELRNHAAHIADLAKNEIDAFETIRTGPARDAEKTVKEDLNKGPGDTLHLPKPPKRVTEYTDLSRKEVDKIKEGGCVEGPSTTIEEECKVKAEKPPDNPAIQEVMDALCDDEEKKKEYIKQASEWCMDENAVEPVPHGGGCIPQCDNKEGSSYVRLWVMSGAHDGSLKRDIPINGGSGCKDAEGMADILMFQDEACCKPSEDENAVNICTAGKCDTMMYAQYQHCIDKKTAEGVQELANMNDADPEDLQDLKPDEINTGVEKPENPTGGESMIQVSAIHDPSRRVLSQASAFLHPAST